VREGYGGDRKGYQQEVIYFVTERDKEKAEQHGCQNEVVCGLTERDKGHAEQHVR
jgi:hypothetical protein